MKEKTNSFKNIKTITIAAMLIAISAIGSLIKVFNTVAFDSMPGYFSALYLANPYGSIVIGFGHLFTALTSGFPLGLITHIYIALQMALYAYIFKICYRNYGGIVAIIAGTLLNGPISSLLFVPMFGWAFFISWVLPLSIASFTNIFLAVLVYKGIARVDGDTID